MALRNRVGLSLQPDIDIPLTELSKLLKTTKTKIILGLLDDMKPHLLTTIKAVKLAQIGKTDLLIASLHEVIDEANERIAVLSLDLNKRENKGKTNGD